MCSSPDAELENRTDELLTRLVSAPRVAGARTKASINAAHRISLAEHLVLQTIDVGACVSEVISSIACAGSSTENESDERQQASLTR